MRPTRYSGYCWDCDDCSRRLRAQTVIGLEAEIVKHVAACAVEREKRERARVQRELAAAAQLQLFGGSS